jgi:hypothetical protein
MFFSFPPCIQSYKLNCVHHEQRSQEQNDLQREGLASCGVELLPCDFVTSINASYLYVLNTLKNQNLCRGSVLVKRYLFIILRESELKKKGLCLSPCVCEREIEGGREVMEGMISNSVHGRRPTRDLKWKNWYGFLLSAISFSSGWWWWQGVDRPRKDRVFLTL